MSDPVQIHFGAGERPAAIMARYANRHGLIAGATGTGKTVTLQVITEAFSRQGIPVFLADVKGDLAGLSQPGEPSRGIQKRVDKLALTDYRTEASPVVFWDLFGKAGHPIRTTISELGPLLLSRLLELNDTQEGVLNVAFRVADDEGLLLLDLADLRALLNFVGENRNDVSTRYGRVTTASIGAIQRRLLVLENAGAEDLFGEPALDLQDFLRADLSGRGIVNVLDATDLIHNPRLYATFLLWLLSELFEDLPEVGDLDKPKLVFFFDEAHLLFDDAPKPLLDKVEQVVRLIRSKGIGVYFCTQNPMDVPDDVLGQLGNRVQHALRAYTPKDRKTIRAVSENFVQNPRLDLERALTEVGVGEAIVSTLGDNGVPSMADHVLICPPRSRMGPIDEAERSRTRAASPIGTRYDTRVDRESAAELLAERATARAQAEKEAAEAAAESEDKRAAASGGKRRSNRQSVWEAAIKSAARSIANQLGNRLVRGILGSLSRR